jgi:hypothetical protein
MMKPRYNANSEALKLAVNNQWSFSSTSVVSRTRGGGSGRPKAHRLYEESDKEVEVVLEEASEAVEEEASDAMEEEGEEVVAPPVLLSKTGRPKKPPKPLHTSVIVQVEQLSSFFDNFHCLQCGNGISMNLRTVCLASQWSVQCIDEDCNFILHSQQWPCSNYSSCLGQ